MWVDKSQSAGRPSWHNRDGNTHGCRMAVVGFGSPQNPKGGWRVVTASEYAERIEQWVDSKETALAIGDKWVSEGVR